MIGLYLKKMKLTSGEIIRVAICLLFTDNIVLISERNMKIMFIGWQIVPYLASHTNALWGLPHNPPLPQMSSEAKGTFFPFCLCMSCTIKGVTFDPEKCEEGWGLNTAGYFN